ncbi:hypothetical protein BT93_B0409 [Corymbia citriodora subsp. variegata]|nr:hypothetical protein BT93_B0409 [Corymbia citriodora subsp. variegata]
MEHSSFSTKRASMAHESPHCPKVQALYDLCRQTFTPSGTPPLSSHSVQKLCSLLDTIGLADVGLSEDGLEDDHRNGFLGLNQLDRIPCRAQPITYINIHECESFKMCIFCFPSSAVIPLHDHAGMTVFSKVLYGSLHVKAYDWIEPARILNKKGPVRLAKLAVANVLTAPCTTSVLYPKTGGNLHCFTAITPSAVLDILSPPYNEDAGRRCTYYSSYPYFTFANEYEKSDEEENYAWLAESGTPDDLNMRPGKYNGPAIQI